jgi:NitT/TauT family transport system substrate-binding protein
MYLCDVIFFYIILNEELFLNRKGKIEMRIRKMKPMFTLLLAVFFAMAFVACGERGTNNNTPAKSSDAGAGETEAAETNAVIMLAGFGRTATTIDAPTIGVAKGFFDEENIEIVDVGSIAVPQLVSALLSDTITAAQIMEAEGISAINGGADIIQVASSQSTVEDNPHITFLVPEESEIQSGKDLVGQKVAMSTVAGGCMTQPPVEYVRQAGVEDPLHAIELISSPEDSSVPALLKGDFATLGIHMTPDKLELLYPETRPLFTDYTVFGEDAGDVGWFFKKSYVEEHPDVIESFVSAIGKTNNWINENPAEAEALFREVTTFDINDELFYVQHFAPDGYVEPQHVNMWVDLMNSEDVIDALRLTKKLSFDEIATNQYNKLRP